MMRLDKFLTELEIGSRSEVKGYIKKGQVTVNGKTCKSNDEKIDEWNDCICFRGQELIYQKFRYYMLNKPLGVVTATRDDKEKTVMDLLNGVNKKDLAPVGRLDKDTEGLLLITNDGLLAHTLLSPKKHVDKTYRVGLLKEIKEEDMVLLEKGVDIGDEKITLPARAVMITPKEILLTIHEGRFHQVKRMLEAVNNKVVSLKRESFGSLKLDCRLESGGFRELTMDEIESLTKDAM